jgi:hypothetical protein
MNPRKPIDIIAHTIPIYPNGFFARVISNDVGDYAEAWED